MDINEVLLEENFYQIGNLVKVVKVQLYGDSLQICTAQAQLDKSDLTIISLNHILGIHATEKRDSGQETFNYTGFPKFLQIFWYPESNIEKDGKNWSRFRKQHITLSLCSDGRPVSQASTRLNLWVKYVRYCKEGLPKVSLDKVYKFITPVEKPILFLVNPKSGQGKGESIFWKSVAPVFKEAGKPFELKLTSRPNHARDYMRTECLQKWKAVVAVSGDGLLHEMINGLFERKDWRQASRIPFGIIPAGSGNGLARSLSHWKNEDYVGDGLEQACLKIARGKHSNMDLTFVETEDSCLYSFLSIAFAFLSDVDIESETLRWMGEMRFYVLSIFKVINPTYYRVKLSYLLADEQKPETLTSNQCSQRIRQDTSSSEGYHSQGEIWSRDRIMSLSESTNMIRSLSEETRLEDSSVSLDSIEDSDPDSDQVSSKPSSGLDSSPQMHVPNHGYPRLKDPIPANWKTIEDDFFILNASYQSHLAKDLCISPDSKPDDGVIWLTLVRRGKCAEGKVPMSTIISFLINSETGNHIHHENVEMLAVKAFRLQPMDRSVGNLTVDGEKINTGPIQAVVLPSACNIIS